MTKRIIQLLLVVFLFTTLIGLEPAFANRTYWVRNGGSDANSGLDSANGFATVKKAYDVLRALTGAGRHRDSLHTIYGVAGVYREHSIWTTGESLSVQLIGVGNGTTASPNFIIDAGLAVTSGWTAIVGTSAYWRYDIAGSDSIRSIYSAWYDTTTRMTQAASYAAMLSTANTWWASNDTSYVHCLSNADPNSHMLEFITNTSVLNMFYWNASNNNGHKVKFYNTQFKNIFASTGALRLSAGTPPDTLLIKGCRFVHIEGETSNMGMAWNLLYPTSLTNKIIYVDSIYIIGTYSAGGDQTAASSNQGTSLWRRIYTWKNQNEIGGLFTDGATDAAGGPNNRWNMCMFVDDDFYAGNSQCMIRASDDGTQTIDSNLFYFQYGGDGSTSPQGSDSMNMRWNVFHSDSTGRGIGSAVSIVHPGASTDTFINVYQNNRHINLWSNGTAAGQWFWGIAASEAARPYIRLYTGQNWFKGGNHPALGFWNADRYLNYGDHDMNYLYNNAVNYYNNPSYPATAGAGGAYKYNTSLDNLTINVNTTAEDSIATLLRNMHDYTQMPVYQALYWNTLRKPTAPTSISPTVLENDFSGEQDRIRIEIAIGTSIAGDSVVYVINTSGYGDSSSAVRDQKPYVAGGTIIDTMIISATEPCSLYATCWIKSVGDEVWSVRTIASYYMVGVSPPNALTEFSLYPAWLDVGGVNTVDTVRIKVGHPSYTGDEPDSIHIVLATTNYPDSNDTGVLQFWVDYNAGVVEKYWRQISFTEPAILYASAWVYEGGAGVWSSRSQTSVLMPDWRYENVYPLTLNTGYNSDTVVLVQRDETPLNRSYSGQAIALTGSAIYLKARGDTLSYASTAHHQTAFSLSGNYATIESLTIIQVANTDTYNTAITVSGASHHTEIRYCNLHMRNQDASLIAYSSPGTVYQGTYHNWIHHNNLTNWSQSYFSRNVMPTAAVHCWGTRVINYLHSYADSEYTFKINNNITDSSAHTIYYLAGKCLVDSNTMVINRHNDKYTYPTSNSAFCADNAFGIVMIGNSGGGYDQEPYDATGGYLGRFEEGIHAGTKIRWNTITTLPTSTSAKSEGSNGIALGGSGSDANPMEIAYNYVSVSAGPSDYTDSYNGTGRGLKVENESGNFLLHHNTFIATSDSLASTGHVGTSAVAMQISAWQTATTDTTFGYMRIYNNRVYGICDSVGTNSKHGYNESTALSICIDTYVDSVYTWNNYFMGNCYVVYNEWSVQGGYVLNDWYSKGDTFNFTMNRRRGIYLPSAPHGGDSAVIKIEGSYSQRGNVIRNPVFINTSSAGYHTVSTDSLLWTQRSCSLQVLNASNNPISGATWTTINSYNKTVGSGTTGSQGYILGNYNYRYDGSPTDSTGYNPHSFIVAASGYVTDTFFVSLTDNLANVGRAVQDTLNLYTGEEPIPPTKIILRGFKK